MLRDATLANGKYVIHYIYFFCFVRSTASIIASYLNSAIETKAFVSTLMKMTIKMFRNIPEFPAPPYISSSV